MFSEEEFLVKKTIHDLPNEILLSIFSNLETHEIKHIVTKVCTRWATLAKDRKLWRCLFFKTTNKTTKIFGVNSWFSTLRFLKTTPEVQNVTLSKGHSEEEIIEIFTTLNEHCQNIRHLEFEEELGRIVKHLKRLYKLFPKVRSLDVNVGSSQNEGVLYLAQFENLKNVIFQGCRPEPIDFWNFLRKSHHLRSVDLSRIDMNVVHFMNLFKLKDKYSSLSLRIDNLEETPLKLLGLFQNLNSLALIDGHASPKKLSVIGDLKCVSCLHLQEAAASPVLTPTALKEFFQTGYFLKLTVLKLHNSRLNDEGAAQIRLSCVSLEYLDVVTYQKSRSSLTQMALLHFLHCPRLEYLIIIFDNSEETDWIYRRKRYVRHDCSVDVECPMGLQEILTSWDEVLIPVD